MTAAILPQQPASVQPEPEVWISDDGAPYVHLIRIGLKFYPARIVRTQLAPAERKANRRTFAQLRREMQGVK